MSKTVEKIKQKWDENPLEVIMVGAFAASAAVAVLNAISAAQGRHAYAKAVNYRIKHG